MQFPAGLSSHSFIRFIFAITLFSAISYQFAPAQEVDPVLEYYVTQAESTLVQNTLFNNSVKFGFEATSYYKIIGRGGKVTKTDSSVTRYFCTGSVVDSIRAQLEGRRKLPEITFSYPNVFDTNYQHKFFPNDVGGEDLAIGFSPDSSADSLPNGIAVLDRGEFNLKTLYLYFPNPKGFKRLTRSFRTSDFSGYTFPDSIWEVGAKEGIFTTEYYRLETKISNIQLLR